MSQESVEIVRGLNAAFNAGDHAKVLELCDRGVEYRDHRSPADLPEVVRGVGELALVLRNWMDAYDELVAEAYEYIDADPWVIVDVRWHGRGKGSDIALADVRQADAVKIIDGRIVEFVAAYPDVATALKAVGVEE